MFGYQDPIYQASLIFSFIFIVSVLIWSVRSGYTYVKKEKEMDKIEEEFDRLRGHRQELKQHYYWSKENKEYKKMDKIGDDLYDVDERLEKMKEKFDYVF